MSLCLVSDAILCKEGEDLGFFSYFFILNFASFILVSSIGLQKHVKRGSLKFTFFLFNPLRSFRDIQMIFPLKCYHRFFFFLLLESPTPSR